jgi:REP element-mobilizing transposase RayT
MLPSNICRNQGGHMQLGFHYHGGYRDGAGRKRRRSRGVAHDVREKVSGRVPLHINFKYKIPVRNKETLKILKRSISNARRHGLRIIHFSFQSNHVHLIIEATSNEILTRGMRSLTNTMAKRIGKGRIQIERYHLHILKTFREARNAIHYVLFNEQKHDSGTCSSVNEYSSLLSIKEGLELIRKFAKKKKISIRIERTELWKGDESRSYVYKKAWETLLNLPEPVC